MCKGTVLIAEDEQYTRNTLSFVLENAGYQVMEAMNGQEALYLILHLKQSEHPIDLLILDIEISGLTGWQVLDGLQCSQISIRHVCPGCCSKQENSLHSGCDLFPRGGIYRRVLFKQKNRIRADL